MFRRTIALLLLAALVSPAWADDALAATATPTLGVADWSPTEMFFFFEGITTVNSAGAAANPRVMGGLILLTSPLALAETPGPLKQSIVAASGYAAIGVYDTTHYPAVYSRHRAFAENFAAWNLWAGMTLLMAQGSGSAAKLAQHLSVTPQAHGGLHLDYHWTF